MSLTILKSLKSINAYPIATDTLREIAEARGLTIDGETSQGVRSSFGFRLAKADVLMWLSQAPDISQAGISYSFTDAERLNFRRRAAAIYKDCGEDADDSASGITYGYKGELL